VSLLALSLLLVTPVVANAKGELALLRANDAHGQPLDPAQLHGQVVAVTFCSRYTKNDVGPINDKLLAGSPGGDVRVVSVIDFEGIPRMFHNYARRKVAESDRPNGVTHLVDDTGQLRRVFNTDPRHRVDIVVLDRDGTVRGHFIGSDQVDDALRLMNDLRRARL
jgi:cytochrome oxidase Cu insertion factor (SCO1/SenC/PrrC family)